MKGFKERGGVRVFTEEEFEAAARKHMDGIFRLALNYMGSFAEAEDVRP